MAFLEIRRHSHRKSGGGSQLSQAGVELARRVGATSGPYVEVVSSVLPRARETAIAMGFAVDREMVTQLTDENVLAAFERISAAVGRVSAATSPFATLRQTLRKPDPSRDEPDQDILYRWSQTVVGLWRDLLTPHGTSDAKVLFVGHSGDLEAGLVSCLPSADHASWGSEFGPMEGAVLEFGGEPARFQTVQILRV